MKPLILKTTLAALALLPCTITAAAETVPAAQPATSPPAAGTASPGIVLSPTFTTGIEGDEPTEYLSEIENTQPTVYFLVVFPKWIWITLRFSGGPSAATGC